VLHDLGKVVMAYNDQDRYAAATELMKSNQISSSEAEAEIFGATHGQVGAYLLGLWGLPDEIVEAVAFHHQPMKCATQILEAPGVIHVADFLAHTCLNSNAETNSNLFLDSDYLEGIGCQGKVAHWEKLITSILEED
jgi:HD-like signal output (HDOD) protein